MAVGQTNSKLKDNMKMKFKDKAKHHIAFTCHAPDAKCVCVAGSFCDWRADALPMRREGNGHWRTTVHVAPGRYEYRFVVDGEWRDDPDNIERVQNDYGTENCVLNV